MIVTRRGGQAAEAEAEGEAEAEVEGGHHPLVAADGSAVEVGPEEEGSEEEEGMQEEGSEE